MWCVTVEFFLSFTKTEKISFSTYFLLLLENNLSIFKYSHMFMLNMNTGTQCRSYDPKINVILLFIIYYTPLFTIPLVTYLCKLYFFFPLRKCYLSLQNILLFTLKK